MANRGRGIEDVIIVGAGPAGLAAALQLRRFGVAALVLERQRAGGLLQNANLVENYLGFPAGVSGLDLARLFVEQANAGGVHPRMEEVVGVTHDGDLFRVLTQASVYRSRVLVVASGTKPRELVDPPVVPSMRDRVLFEVYPLLDAVDKRVAIIGAGDAAFDYALNLGKRNDVLILNRGKALKCIPLLHERAGHCVRITYREETRVLAMSPAAGGGIDLQCRSLGSFLTIRVDNVVAAIGREPQLGFLSIAFLERAPQLEAQGLLYFIGDVRNGMHRQTAIAVGDGLHAAMKIWQHLQQSPDPAGAGSDRELVMQQNPREETKT